jgi:ubiquinone/menaquinone biosynthesis C-methylase UbiE
MTSFADIERDGWNDRAQVYATTTARATTQAIPQLLGAVRPKFGDDLLDICTGPGFAAGAAAAIGCEVTGVDFAESMVGVAAKNFPACEFATGDAQALEFDDGTFDAALCNFGVFHFANPESAIREAARVLKPSGRYAWSQWWGPDKSPFFATVFKAVATYANMDIGLPESPPPFRFSDTTLATSTMEDAGFDDIEITEVLIVLHAPALTFFDFFNRFSVRMTMVLDRQEPSVRERIECEIAAGLKKFDHGGTLQLPIPAFVVSGRKTA